MKLYLMQHALAYPADKDPERALSPQGVDQAKAAARGLKRLGLTFDLIITSPKRRAQQTAALVAEAVRYPYSDIFTTVAVAPESPPEELLALLQKEPTDSQVLVVGHMPHLANLARQLLQGGTLLFENAGLTSFEMTGPKTADLEFHLQTGHFAL